MSKLGVVIFIHNKAKNCVVTGYSKVFNEGVDKKNKYKKQKAIWFEYTNSITLFHNRKT